MHDPALSGLNKPAVSGLLSPNLHRIDIDKTKINGLFGLNLESNGRANESTSTSMADHETLVSRTMDAKASMVVSSRNSKAKTEMGKIVSIGRMVGN